jgi:uncharacterized protein
MKQTWFQTYSGLIIDLQGDPDSWVINIEDIAHALSNICRWGGHGRTFYSVAQHSFEVSWIAGDTFAFAGLLHDAAEAYVGDMISPVKAMQDPGYDFFTSLEDDFHDQIAKQFGLSSGFQKQPGVKWADQVQLRREAEVLFDGRMSGRMQEWVKALPASSYCSEHVPWSPEKAKKNFLDRFYLLKAQKPK